ncbi:MAG: hypothetical protein RJAPGHWK_002167 [Candidatus Fervidibacter sp.]
MSQVRTLPAITDDLLSAIVQTFRDVDADLVAVILFGSAVYAPDLARDLDFLVITGDPKERQRYQEAALQVARGWEVDVVVCRVGEKVRGLSGAVKAFGKVLWGDERWLWEVTKDMPIPSFDDARRTVREAEMDAQEAMRSQDAWHADSRWHSAYNWLFEAARRGAMAFLNTQESRWGVLRGQLPEPFQSEFREFINALHVRFWYEGDYPQDNPEGHFQTWRDRVAKFIRRLGTDGKAGVR